MIARRTFIKGASMLTLAAATSPMYVRESSAQQVPNSAGTEPATLKAPPGACDCHHHIYDEVRFPPATPGGRIIPDARVEEFRMLQRRIGTSRNIVVTPSAKVEEMHETMIEQAARMVIQSLKSDPPAGIVVDLSQVTYFGSVFVSFLLRCHVLAKKRGSELIRKRFPSRETAYWNSTKRGAMIRVWKRTWGTPATGSSCEVSIATAISFLSMVI